LCHHTDVYAGLSLDCRHSDILLPVNNLDLLSTSFYAIPHLHDLFHSFSFVTLERDKVSTFTLFGSFHRSF
jgi:hypothetical protein